MLPMINWPIFLMFAIAPYIIAIVMPNRKWLDSFGLFWAITSTFLLMSAYGIDNGLMMAFTVVSFYGIVLSGFSGIAARGISLFLRSRNFSGKAAIIPLIIGFPLGLIIFHLPFKLQEWKERPPEEECLANSIPVKLGAYSFYLPQVPVFTVIPAPPDNNQIIRFHQNSGLRYACEESNCGQVAISSIAIDFSPAAMNLIVYPAFDKTLSRFCSRPRHGWQAELCKDKGKRKDLDYPEQVFIYDIRQIGNFPYLNVHRSMSLTRNIGSTYDAFKNLIQDTTQEASDIEGYTFLGGEYYWVSNDGEQLTPDGKPFALVCGAGTNKAHISCRTAYGLDENIYVQFAISGEASETPDKAWIQSKKLQIFLESLEQKN